MTIDLHQPSWNRRMTNSGFEEPFEKFFPLPAVEPIYKLVNGLHKMHYRHTAACSYEEAFDDTYHRMYRRKPLFCLWARSNLGAMLMMLYKNLQCCQGIGPKLSSRHQALAELLYMLEISSFQLLSRYATDTLAMPHYGEHCIPPAFGTESAPTQLATAGPCGIQKRQTLQQFAYWCNPRFISNKN